jgi:hypothetical protein
MVTRPVRRYTVYEHSDPSFGMLQVVDTYAIIRCAGRLLMGQGEMQNRLTFIVATTYSDHRDSASKDS